jgi:DNA-binding NarL/FixJ family response regulator
MRHRHSQIPGSWHAIAAPSCDPAVVQLRYLIADDSAPFLEASRTLLLTEGLDVIGTAATAAECVGLARKLNPDVILVDVDLGSDSGLALADRLSEASAHWRVILMSTRSVEDYAELVAASDAVGFITKTELSRSAIERVLGAARPRRLHR